MWLLLVLILLILCGVWVTLCRIQKQLHLHALYRVIKYVKKQPSLGILLSSHNELKGSAYCDSDWGSCVETRKSIFGYCIFLGKSLISCMVKKQATISQISAEVEYRSILTTLCEIIWYRGLLTELGISFHLPTTLFCDN